MELKFVTLADLADTIRKNLWKVPRDIDYIVSIPRSGTIAASIISSFLNVPLIDINSLVAGVKPYGGGRLMYFKPSHTGRALVVDDTVWGGGAKEGARAKLSRVGGMEFIFMVVYLEGPGEKFVDLWLEDMRGYTDNFRQIVLYEWNIMQHHENNMRRFLFDLDGVFCLDPPDEREVKEYESYISNATPLFIPRSPLGGIITYRLEKYRGKTEEWLHGQGISYGRLVMCDSRSISPHLYKGRYYRDHDFSLFIESERGQAEKIAKISGKPVYCVESNRVYQ